MSRVYPICRERFGASGTSHAPVPSRPVYTDGANPFSRNARTATTDAPTELIRRIPSHTVLTRVTMGAGRSPLTFGRLLAA
jgi:hypothetical protein